MKLNFGVPGGSRTHDTGIKSPLLWPLSYRRILDLILERFRARHHQFLECQVDHSEIRATRPKLYDKVFGRGVTQASQRHHDNNFVQYSH